MTKEINVSPHLRRGKAVTGHVRKTTLPENKVSDCAHPPKNSLFDLVQQVDTEPTLLFDVNGREVDLSKTTVIKNMDFDSMDLSGSDFGNITKIENCFFPKAKFEGLNLGNIEVVDCDFEGAEFNEVSLEKTKFKNCSFDGTTINGKGSDDQSNWQFVSFEDCSFKNSTIKNMKVSTCEFKANKFENNEMSFVGFYNCELDEVEFRKTNFELVNFGSSVFNECDFLHCNMGNRRRYQPNESKNPTIANSRISDSRFSDCYMTNISILDSEIHGTDFSRVHAKGANLQGTTASDIFVSLSDFTDSNFNETNLKNFSLEETELTGSSWENAKADIDFRYSSHPEPYEKYSFDKIQEILGLTESQFEFLVVSGAVEVRHNGSGEKVASGFNPDIHHVPVWNVPKLEKMIEGHPAEKQDGQKPTV